MCPPILVSGEFAGGGLALSLALALRDAAGDERGRPPGCPRDSHVVSPFCDLALSAEQLGTATGTEPWFNRIALIQLAACYIHDTDPGQPLVSPSACADLSGLPPLLIQAAEPEALFPGAERLASQARGARVPVTFSPGRRTACPLLHPVRLPARNRPRTGRVRRVRCRTRGALADAAAASRICSGNQEQQPERIRADSPTSPLPTRYESSQDG